MTRYSSITHAMRPLTFFGVLTLGAQPAFGHLGHEPSNLGTDDRVIYHSHLVVQSLAGRYCGYSGWNGSSSYAGCRSDVGFGGHFNFNGYGFGIRDIRVKDGDSQDSNDGDLYLEFKDDIPTSLSSHTFKLWVHNGDTGSFRSFSLTDISSGSKAFDWLRTGLTWSSGTQIRVFLTIDPATNVAPQFHRSSTGLQQCGIYGDSPAGAEVCGAAETGARDANDDRLSYRLSGRDAYRFRVNSSTGAVGLRAASSSILVGDSFCRSGQVRIRGIGTDDSRGKCYEFNVIASDNDPEIISDDDDALSSSILVFARTMANSLPRSAHRCVPVDDDPMTSLDNTVDANGCVRATGRFDPAGVPASSAEFYQAPPEETAQAQAQAALTVAYEQQPPASHDGSTPFTFQFAFSQDLASDFSYTTMRDHSLTVMQGESSLTPKVRRLVQGSNQRWEATVTPAGNAAISIALGPTNSCSDAGAMCTDAGTALSNALPATTVAGPTANATADPPTANAADPPTSNTVVLEPNDPRGSRDIGTITLVSSQPGTIQASWQAPTETPADYRISWAKAGENFKTWTDNTGNAFPTAASYTITGLEGGEQYKVMVRARYNGSSGDWSGQAVITVVESASSKPVVPSLTFELGANYPNPFNPETQIAYSLSTTGPVELAIYTILGQRVRTLVQETQAAGSYQVSWNGRNDQGAPVASGIYLYRLSSAQEVQMRRLLLLK